MQRHILRQIGHHHVPKSVEGIRGVLQKIPRGSFLPQSTTIPSIRAEPELPFTSSVSSIPITSVSTPSVVPLLEWQMKYFSFSENVGVVEPIGTYAGRREIRNLSEARYDRILRFGDDRQLDVAIQIVDLDICRHRADRRRPRHPRRGVCDRDSNSVAGHEAPGGEVELGGEGVVLHRYQRLGVVARKSKGAVDSDTRY